MVCAGYRLLNKSQTWLKTVVLAFSHQPRRALFSYCGSHLSSVACLWGAGDAGQLGTGTQKLKSKPIKLEVESEVSHVGCGFGFTVVAEAHRCRLWTTGLNSSSQLGTRPHYNSEKDLVLSPVLVDLQTDSPSTRIKQISCGRSHTAVLTDSGEVFVCGGNSQGQCGMGHFDLQYIEHFSKISYLGVSVKQVSCGLDHTLLLTNDGKVFSCGWSADGQTGLGHFQNEASFKLLEGALIDVKIKQIATSADCCLALSEDGEVFSWGNNEYGQLAISDDQEQLAHPSRASSLETLLEIVDVAAGGSFCVVLTVTGELYSWGYGVLGHGPEGVFTKVPRRLRTFSDIDDRVGHVTCGPDMAAVVTDSGSLYTWGRGSFGRLGVGSDSDQWTPKKVELPGEVTEVSCGVDHMAVVLKDNYS